MAKRRYDDDEYHWYALDVMRQKEYAAGHLLNKMGCMTFIPTETRFRKKSRHAKTKMEVAYASFSGVVFAGFPEAPRWFEVMSISLINGVLSLPDETGRMWPRRIDTACREWINYRARLMDGQLVIERHRMPVRIKGETVEVDRSVPLISVQGKGVIRSPAMLKTKASANRPLVVRAAGERARMLGALLEASDKPSDHQQAA